MNTIALSTLMSGLEDFIEEVAISGAADAGSDATKIVDAALATYGDGYFISWWAYVTSGSASGNKRQIESFTKATYTLDPFIDFSAAVAAGNTYELHRHNPDLIIRALNAAFGSIFPKLHRRIVFENIGRSLMTSNAASAQKDVIVADATLFFVGQTVTVKDDSSTETAIIASITTATNTLTMTSNLTNSYTTAANGVVVAGSGHYFNLGATLGNARITNVYIRESSADIRTANAAFEVIWSNAGSRQLYLPSETSVDDQTLVVEAIDVLETVSAVTDTITLETKHLPLLYSEAAYHLCSRLANDISSGDWDRLQALAASYGPFNSPNQNKANTIYKRLCMALPRERADLTVDSDYDE